MKYINNIFVFLKKPLISRISLIAIVVLILWFFVGLISSASSWKAVFIDNGQVYFGKGWWLPFSDTVTLRHVYYVRPQDGATTTGAQSLQVLSLQEEPQSPKSTLDINKSHILYIEYLNTNSTLAKAIVERDALINK